MKIKHIVGLLLITMLTFHACESMDDNFREYLGEYNYSGKITNLRVYPGYERVVLAWDNPKDQKSKTIKIVYGPDSTEIAYDSMVDSVSVDGLVAGTGYEFIVYTLDDKNNISVPVSVTAFPISSSFVETLTSPSLVIEVQNNEQVISLIGLSNVLMRFAGKIDYAIAGPNDFFTEGEIDITDEVISTDPNTGLIVYNTINNLSIPVTDLGYELLPPGEYTFTYTVAVWPIIGNQISIDQVELTNDVTIDVQPIIINITSLGGVVSDQYNKTGGEGIDKLVDGDINSKYLAGARTTWMMFKTNDPAIVTRYSLTSANDARERDPKNWTLQASNDGVNWTVLDQRQDIAFPIRFQTQTFEIEGNDTLYQYYKLDVTENAGSSIFQLAEWTLFGPKLLSTM